MGIIADCCMPFRNRQADEASLKAYFVCLLLTVFFFSNAKGILCMPFFAFFSSQIFKRHTLSDWLPKYVCLAIYDPIVLNPGREYTIP